jgi:hypothetical protein
MALRNQPYLPLYVQDFLTDENLIECSAEATGVYIRIMCIMHKSKDYGTILLQQKDKQIVQQKTKQNEQQVFLFASKIAKHLPYSLEIIFNSILELVNEEVLTVNGDYLVQKRMVKDNDISCKRSTAGRKGGFATAKDAANNTTKDTANSENEIENEIIVLDNKIDAEEFSILTEEPKYSINQAIAFTIKPYVAQTPEFKKMHTEKEYVDYQWFINLLKDNIEIFANIFTSEYQVTFPQYKKLISKFSIEEIPAGLQLLCGKPVLKEHRMCHRIVEYIGYIVERANRGNLAQKNGNVATFKPNANTANYTNPISAEKTYGKKLPTHAQE